MNMLTPDRPQSRGTSSMSPNSCLVEVEKWQAPRLQDGACSLGGSS